MFKIYLTTALVSMISLTFTVSLYSQKMSSEDILAKHLNSIGSKEKRQVVKNQLVYGDVDLTIRGSAVPVRGNLVVFSTNEKSVWGMKLNSNDYPSDKFGFDGKDTKVGFTRPGVRSILGGFIYSYPELLREGLMGGTLTSSWALLNTELRKPKLSYEGIKKIDGRETYILSYSVKKGSDLSIKMYFDAETFQHLRTEYIRVISARQGSNIDNSAGQGEDRYRLTEDFSNFKRAGDLMLPTKYNLTYNYTSSGATRNSNNAARYFEWKFNITNFSYNQQMNDDTFSIDTK